MELHQIRYFLAVCEAMNFTRAAETAHVTQPALTRAIRKLEDELGGALFERARNGITLTDLGRIVRDNFEKMDNLRNKTRAAAENWRRGSSGIIRVGVEELVGERNYCSFFARWGQKQPDIAMHFRSGPLQDLLDELESSTIDTVVGASLSGSSIPNGAIQIGDEAIGVILRKDHALAQQDAITWNQIAGESVVDMAGIPAAVTIAELLWQRPFPVRARIVAPSRAAVLDLIMAGVGIGLGSSEMTLWPGLEFRRLLAPELVRVVYVLTLPGPSLSKVMEAFEAYTRRIAGP